jgi:hypothetical protein
MAALLAGTAAAYHHFGHHFWAIVFGAAPGHHLFDNLIKAAGPTGFGERI